MTTAAGSQVFRIAHFDHVTLRPVARAQQVEPGDAAGSVAVAVGLLFDGEPAAAEPLRLRQTPRMHTPGMDLGAKLQIKPGQRIATVADADDTPPIAAAGATTADTPEAADVIVAFVRTQATLHAVAAPAIDAARRDKLAWIAYPKAGKLGTDLNRDIIRESLAAQGVQPVRQIAIDEVWSALRFRPA